MKSGKANHIGVVICLYTGIRLGELLALTWKDVDFVTGIMCINKTSYRIKENGTPRIVIDRPKTKNSSRVIPLPKTLLDILKKMKKKSTSEYVITTRTGGIVGTRAYQRTYERILVKLDIPHKNFHSLRHTKINSNSTKQIAHYLLAIFCQPIRYMKENNLTANALVLYSFRKI